MKFSQKLKRVAGVLSLLMVFQVAFTQIVPAKSASAAGEQVTYKAISGDPTKVGSIIEFAVNVSGVKNVYGASVDFKYDPSILEVQSINKGTAYGSTAVQIPVKEIKNGEARLGLTMTGSTSNGVTLNGTLAVIKAKVLKAGKVNVNFTSSDADLSLSGNTTRVKFSTADSGKISYTSANTSFGGVNPPPTDKVTITSLTSNKKSGEPLGSTITFTALTNDTANSDFEFYVKEGSTWVKKQAWSGNNTFSYKPSKYGNFTVRAHAKHKSSSFSQSHKDMYYFIKNPATMAKIKSLTPNTTTGQVGVPMTFTALTNITTASMFEFWVKEGSTWVKKQAWSSSNKFNWTPNKKGTYTIRVHARHKNYNTSDGYKDINIVVK